jgi:hypothetical protein
VIIVALINCIRAVINYLLAKGSSAIEIYQVLFLVDRPTLMCERKVRQWYLDFENGQK